jgi:hypothetical protein
MSLKKLITDGVMFSQLIILFSSKVSLGFPQLDQSVVDTRDSYSIPDSAFFFTSGLVSKLKNIFFSSSPTVHLIS